MATPLIRVEGGSGLVYVSDDMPGITRVQGARGFRYRSSTRQWIKDKDEIARINKLAIPPAYTGVWICENPSGHLQATGLDARGRKQYRYHPDWQAMRNESKFERMQAFGAVLPRIRLRVACELAGQAPYQGQPMTRSLVLATLVRLLDTTYARVGNDEYARTNGSFGLTTLRNPHADVRGAVLRLQFRGKSGVMQSLEVTDSKVAAVVRTCQQLPGQLLFQYEDEEGKLHAIGSSDVNEYLAALASEGARRPGRKVQAGDAQPAFPGYGRCNFAGGQDVISREQQRGHHLTAKDFRTWHGTVQALELTWQACNRQTEKSYNAKIVLKEVARQLGNTPAVCRKSYIHPAVMGLGAELTAQPAMLASIAEKLGRGKATRRLYAAEVRLLAFLKFHQQERQKPERLTASRTRKPAVPSNVARRAKAMPA